MLNNLTDSQSERYLHLSRMMRYLENKQHSHKRVMWNNTNAPESELDAINFGTIVADNEVTERVKLDNKRPDAPENLAEVIVGTFTDLLFEEDRRPSLVLNNDEWLKWYSNFIEQTNFWDIWSEVRNDVGAASSGLICLEFNEGIPFIYKVESRHCLPSFSAGKRFKDELDSVLIMYVYDSEEIEEYEDHFEPIFHKKQKTRIATVQRWYKRIITKTSDILYSNPKYKENDTPVFTEVKRFDHNFGYVPALWLRNSRDVGIDSISDFEGATGLLDKVDMLSSMIARSALYNGDPTVHIATNNEVEDIIRSGSFTSFKTEAGGKVSFVELEGTSIDIMLKAKSALRDAALAKCRCVLELSSVAGRDRVTATEVTKTQSQMYAKASKLRGRFGEYIKRFLFMAAQSCRSLDPGVNDGEYDHSEFSVNDDFVTPAGDIEKPRLNWGKFSTMSPSDLKVLAESVSVMLASKCIDRRTAVEMIAPHVTQRTPDQIMKMIELESGDTEDEEEQEDSESESKESEEKEEM